MKLNRYLKIIKNSSIGVVIVVPILSTTIVVNSCGHNKTPPKAKFSDFSKAAQAESAENIVNYTKPTNWEKLPKNDLDKKLLKITNASVVVVIKSKSRNETAIFTAVFNNKKYQVSAWNCSTAPEPIAYDWASATKELLVAADNNKANDNNIVDYLYDFAKPIKPSVYSKFPNLYKFFNLHLGVDSINIRVMTDPSTFVYNATGGINKFGQMTFDMKFFMNGDINKTALVTGGHFFINRNAATDKADPTFSNIGISKDVS